MSNAKQIDVYSIEARLKKSDKEAWQYIKALKFALKREQELTSMAISKIRDQSLRIKELTSPGQ